MLDKLARYFKIYIYIYISKGNTYTIQASLAILHSSNEFFVFIFVETRGILTSYEIYTRSGNPRDFRLEGKGWPFKNRVHRERLGERGKARSIAVEDRSRYVYSRDGYGDTMPDLINAASNFPRESDNFKRVSLSRERVKVHGEKAFDHHFGKSKTWAVPNQSSARYYININNYDIWETMRDHTRTPRPSCIAFKKRPLHLFEILRFRASTSFWFRDLIFLHSHSVFFNDKGRTSIALT